MPVMPFDSRANSISYNSSYNSSYSAGHWQADAATQFNLLSQSVIHLSIY